MDITAYEIDRFKLIRKRSRIHDADPVREDVNFMLDRKIIPGVGKPVDQSLSIPDSINDQLKYAALLSDNIKKSLLLSSLFKHIVLNRWTHKQTIFDQPFQQRLNFSDQAFSFCS